MDKNEGQQQPMSQDSCGTDSLGCPMTEEEIKARFDALPIEEKLKHLQSQFLMLHSRCNYLKEQLGELNQRQYVGEQAFNSHTHPQLGMSPFVPAEQATLNVNSLRLNRSY